MNLHAPAPEDDAPLIENDAEDIELDILNEMNSSPNDVTYSFRVGRVTGIASKGANEPELFRGDGTDVNSIFDKLKEEYGDGKYRIRIHKNGRLWRRFDMAIELPKSAKTPSAAPAVQSEMALVLASIEKSNERMIALMERVAERNAIVPAVVPALDPMAMFDKILGVVQKLAPQSQSGDVAGKSVELILQGIELGKSVSGEARETGMMDIVRDLLNSPLVAKLAEGAAAQPHMPQVRLPPRRPMAPPSNGQAKPEANPANLQENPPLAGQSDNAAQIAETRKILHYLLAKAERGSSFETYAEWCFDSLPPQLINEVLAQADPVAALAVLAPEIGPYKEWFASLIDELRDLVNDVRNVSNPAPSAVHPNGNPERQGGGPDNFEDNE